MRKQLEIGMALGLLLAAGPGAEAQSSLLPEQPSHVTPPSSAGGFVLEDGTPVQLRVGRTLSSKEARVGDSVDFEVIHDVTLNGIPVIPTGSLATGKVADVHGKRRMGRGGKLTVLVDSVQLVDGSRASLRSGKQAKGGGHIPVMTMGMAAAGLIYFPVAPAFLFVRGKDSTLLKGTELTAYVDGDFPLERSRVQAAAAAFRTGSASSADSQGQTVGGREQLGEFIGQLPKRTLDADGREGDGVNLAFVGSREVLTSAFERAGWVIADRSTPMALLHAIEKPKSYVAMPMSKLFLFGRRQDYGFEMAEPVSVVKRRHHIRVWQTDSQIDGAPVWAGAATQDIGLEKDSRNLGLTHKIDPDVDGERDFIGSSLMQTHIVSSMTYESPAASVQDAFTATGENFHSDGRILVIVLQADRQ